MSRTSAANYNGRLTSYATGFSQKPRENGIADFVFPNVPTGTSQGQFKKYSGKNAFQVVDTLRALGEAPNAIKFEADDGVINCRPHGLEIPIDDAERDAAGDEPNAEHALEEGKVSTLITTAQLSREIRAQALIDSLAPVDGKGVWSDAGKDPIIELDEQIEAIVTQTGMMPNRLAMGFPAWLKLRHHPKVIARQPGAANIGLTTAQLSAMLAIPLQIKIGTLSRDTAKWGNAKNAQQIVGAKVLVFIGNETPTIYDPSFGKTFTTRRGNVEAVNVVRHERASSDIVQVKWSEQMQVIYTEAARLLALS
ncbi:hypothetical protein [Geminisphaera colitermitum]|uniref:hypothetical protein n=1 Tax=Geminisphaera colitermitum TaxID=1148786 RepID=UPI000158C4F3|nr:hypothetical protein [Geminisphaera colitermitum]